MDNAVNIGMCLKDLLERRLIGDIDLVEDGPLAAQQLDAVQADLGRIVQAVDNNHIVAVLEKSEGRERSDVACATVVENIVSTAIFIPALYPAIYGLFGGRRGRLAYPVMRTVPTAIVKGRH